jgi:hypothetical protein
MKVPFLLTAYPLLALKYKKMFQFYYFEKDSRVALKQLEGLLHSELIFLLIEKDFIAV